MRYLITDVETTGLPLYGRKGEPPPAADAPGQPRVCSIAMLPVDENLEVIEADVLSTLIKPDGWEVSEGASAVNGITTAMCEESGIPIIDALRTYSKYVEDGWVVVCHHAIFDTKCLRGELRRAGMPDLFEKTLNICTMKATIDICQLPPTSKMMATGRKAFKQPKLQEAYVHFFGEEFPDAHSALADARACLALLRKLIEIGKCPEPGVTYAKSRTDVPAT